jgi:hypothetical protein
MIAAAKVLNIERAANEYIVGGYTDLRNPEPDTTLWTVFRLSSLLAAAYEEV